MACVALGSVSHALAPGWVLLPGPMPLHALKLRVLAARSALETLLFATVALLAVMFAGVFVSPVISVAVLFAMPVVGIACVGLGAAWAQAVDPRTRKAAPPIMRAELAAIAGAVGAWALPAAAWGLGYDAFSSPAGLLLGPYAVAGAALPLNAVVLRSLAAAGFPLAPPGMMARRATACCTVLLALSALGAAMLPWR